MPHSDKITAMEDGAHATREYGDARSADASALIIPRIVTTGETRSDSATSTRETDSELHEVDQTERLQITTDGKRSFSILHPIPLDTAPPDVAHIDWLAFTLYPPDSEGKGQLSWILPQLAEIFSLSASQVHETRKGWNGYEHRYDLAEPGRDGVQYGLFAFGGKRQRGTVHVSLNGHACARIKDWHKVGSWGQALQAAIKRLDLAHDDLKGETFTIEKMVEWYTQGKFKAGGRQPASFLHGDWLVTGSPNGRTIEIGKRVNGKMLRIYEKGKQLGDGVSPWVRVELELHGKKRIIPWEAVSEPGKYLAGSYPCLNFLTLKQEKIKTLSKAAAISYERSVTHARLMTGKLVNVMMQANHGDAFEVVKQLKRDGVPERLKGYSELIPRMLGGNYGALDN